MTASTSPSLPAAHRLAAQLGYLALLPFVVGALVVWVARVEVRGPAALALSAYAAVIVSFLGGIHWGFAFRQAAPEPRLFVWGVVPALVACAALLLPASTGLAIHGAMLVVCYAVDRKVYAAEGASAWLGLRLRLTAVAGLGCFLGAVGASSLTT